MNKLKYNNEYIDKKLNDDKRNITRIGNCINGKTKIFWQCLSCYV